MRNPASFRTCAGCGGKFDKNGLIRIARLSDGRVMVNITEGRGAYLCKNSTCLANAIKKKRFNYILHSPVPAEIFDELSCITGSDQN